MPKRQPRIKRTNFVPTLSADILRSSIAATKASAVSWPMPGIVISRLQTAEALVIRLMSASIVATALITAERAPSALARRRRAPRPLRWLLHALQSEKLRWRIGHQQNDLSYVALLRQRLCLSRIAQRKPATDWQNELAIAQVVCKFTHL